MAITLDINDPAIVRGIKTVGVGKKGSKPLSPELSREIFEDLKANKVSAASKGAFFAGLIAKGITPDEAILVKDAQQTIAEITSDAPEFVRWTCQQLLSGHSLDKQTAYDLGKFLFSNEPGDGARGLIASFLRVRYETDDEYQGIWQAMQETIAPAFRDETPAGEPIVQLSEPFDGNDHSYMITPLIADHIQSLGFRAIHMVGRNSGPKSVYNLLDVADKLPTIFATNNAALGLAKPPYGWFFHQKDVSPALDHWVDIRHQTIKRPFLATLEKFIKPNDAQIIVTSAFHPPYGEKMLTISERAGFRGAMVVRNGIEGSMAFPLKRPAKMLLSAQQKDGSYKRYEIEFDAEKFLGTTPATEEIREQLSADENARLIKLYFERGSTRDPWFDLRVKATLEGFRQGLQWLRLNMERG